IFVDATKAEYDSFFEFAREKLKVGGVLIADNINSHKEVLQDFVKNVKLDSNFKAEVLDLGSGLLVAFREF
ncbi:O-methyltransferase, partial [Candidatus Peregrinibacteria bacterium]|nr:O-methyltransferase [Candidatus Peregrinibacteria bacterium]